MSPSARVRLRHRYGHRHHPALRPARPPSTGSMPTARPGRSRKAMRSPCPTASSTPRTDPASVAAIRFAAVTGLRIGEVLAIRWADVDVEQARLTIPEGKTGRRQHDLPIPALDVFGGIHRINDEWAFSTGRSHVTYRHVRTVFAEAVRVAGLLDVRLHDLRRGVMTRAAAAGVGTHVLRDLLGHRTTVMADRYVRALGSPVREAREAIGAEIAAAMAREGARD